jgi:hypothetical protein
VGTRVCPICNGLIESYRLCFKCNRKMDEIGKMEDYMGPYNPYMDKETFTIDNRGLLMGDDQCVHIYYCESCQLISYGSVPYIL